jgi:hypothetical protein
MARKKDKKADGKKQKKPSVGKSMKKPTQQQSQKQSIHIHLAKSAAKRKPNVATKQSPSISVNPVVYTMPSYSNDLTRLENKISELSTIIQPVKNTQEHIPLAEVQNKVEYYKNPNKNPVQFTSPKILPKEPIAHYTSAESGAVDEPSFVRRRGPIPKAKTPEQLDEERLRRNARKRELYNQKKEQQKNIQPQEDESEI